MSVNFKSTNFLDTIIFSGIDVKYENQIDEKLVLGDKNKLSFYKNLNEEKRKYFDKELLFRNDWYEQAFDIIEGADKADIKSFVSEGMVLRFESDPTKYIQNEQLLAKLKGLINHHRATREHRGDPIGTKTGPLYVLCGSVALWRFN